MSKQAPGGVFEQPPSILVVEDEAIVAADIRATLQSFGYRVPAICANGPDALQKARECQPDLVLMDVHIKGRQDGIEVADELRQSLHISTIYLTANADEKTLQRAKVTAPYGYILKPFEDRELHIVIEMALYRVELERQLLASQALQEATLKSIADGLLTTDTGGRINFVNPMGEALLGQDPTGRTLDQVFRFPGGDPVSPAGWGDNVLLAADGQERPIEWNSTCIIDARGLVLGTVVAFREGRGAAQLSGKTM